MIKHGGPGSYTWIDLDSRSTICLEIRFSTSPDKCCINLDRFLQKKQTQTIPSYTEQFHDGRPRFDKCIRYFIDLQNCIATEKNFRNVQALDRKILYYSRFEAYGILFYLSHQCISWVRIWIRLDISIFSFISFSFNQEPEGFLLLPARLARLATILKINLTSSWWVHRSLCSQWKQVLMGFQM